ncbi:MAG: type II toxin-antitoxin system Phd/YefM family antitoxin [Actinobacteria bacterium]|nr:type II toxin-antitoxin system Phd/YefM family antitoxin [Actinomycetota bacterium]
MRTITVAELRQNPTAALAAVESGESYDVTRHRRVIARLVPAVADPVIIVPPRVDGGSALAARPRAHTHSRQDTDALLSEMSSDW